MREAARVAGVSVSTLRRRRDELTAAGAVIDPNGWQVPITALIAAGLISGEGHHADDNDTPAAAAVTPGGDPGVEVRVRELEQRVQELNEQLHHWQRRAEVAEARAEERARSLEVLRIANESERLALRMLTTGPAHDQNQQHSTETTTPGAADSAAAPQPGHPDVSTQRPETVEDSTRGTRRGGFLRRLFTD